MANPPSAHNDFEGERNISYQNWASDHSKSQLPQHQQHHRRNFKSHIKEIKERNKTMERGVSDLPNWCASCVEPIQEADGLVAEIPDPVRARQGGRVEQHPSPPPPPRIHRREPRIVVLWEVLPSTDGIRHRSGGRHRASIMRPPAAPAPGTFRRRGSDRPGGEREGGGPARGDEGGEDARGEGKCDLGKSHWRL